MVFGAVGKRFRQFENLFQALRCHLGIGPASADDLEVGASCGQQALERAYGRIPSTALVLDHCSRGRACSSSQLPLGEPS